MPITRPTGPRGSDETDFIYERRVLGVLPGFDTSEGEDINDLGLAVGWSSNQFETRATVWSDGEIYDLNDFLPDNTAWESLIQALAVNNSGDIVGVGRLHSGELQGFVYRGFVPAPGTVSITGLACIAGLRRRR